MNEKALDAALDAAYENSDAPDYWPSEEMIRAAITAYLAAMEVEGFVMVPVEPTDEMVLSGLHMEMPVNVTGGPKAYTIRLIAETYRAMIRAYPNAKS